MSFDGVAEPLSDSCMILGVPEDSTSAQISTTDGYCITAPDADNPTMYYVYYIDPGQPIPVSNVASHQQSGEAIVLSQTISRPPNASISSDMPITGPSTSHILLPSAAFPGPVALNPPGIVTGNLCMLPADGHPSKMERSRKNLPKSHTCLVCGVVCETRKLFLQHMAIHESDRPHKCSFCPSTFNHRVNAKVHAEINHSDETATAYRCTFCGYAYSRWAAFKSHMLVHQIDDDIPCPICHKLFKAPCLVEAHRMTEHQLDIVTNSADTHYRCRICRCQLSTLGMLQKHYREYHPNELKKRASRKFTTVSTNESPSVTNTAPVLPVISGQRQSKVDARILLNRICSTERSKRSKPKLLRVPPSENCLQNETNSNTPEVTVSKVRRPYKRRHSTVGRPRKKHFNHTCTICGKRLTAPCYLERHMRHHTSERPFECLICHSRFAQKSSLDAHVLIHNKPSVPHMCAVCNRQFPSLKSLNSHVRLKHRVQALSVFQNAHWPLFEESGANSKSQLTTGAYLFTHSAEMIPTYFDLPAANVVPLQGSNNLPHPTSPIIVVDLGDALPSTTDEGNTLSINQFPKSVQNMTYDKSGSPDKVTSAPVLRRTTKRTGLSCSMCSRRFTSRTQYASHMRVHRLKHMKMSKSSSMSRKTDAHENRPLKWDRKLGCFMSTSRYNVLQTHQCSDCHRSYKHKIHLDYHRRQHHQPESASFTCPHCPKRFVLQSSFQHHLVAAHANGTAKSSVKEQCLLCSRSFTFPSSLKRHMATHSDERPYKCNKCPSQFKFFASCSKHIRTHDDSVEINTQAMQPPTIPLLTIREDHVTTAGVHHQNATWTEDLLSSNDYICGQQTNEYDNNIIPVDTPSAMHAQWETVYVPSNHTEQRELDPIGLSDQDGSTTFILYPSTNYLNLGVNPEFLQTEQFMSQQHQQTLVPVLGNGLCQPTEDAILEEAQNADVVGPSAILDFEIDASSSTLPTGRWANLGDKSQNQGHNIETQAPNEPILSPDFGPTDSNVEGSSTNRVLLYGCGVCSASFKVPEDLLAHSRIVHLFYSSSLECSICGARVASETQLAVHMDQHDANLFKTDVAPLKCPSCPDRSFRSQSGLTRHILLCHPLPLPDRFKCTLCGLKFRVLYSLKVHVRDIIEAMQTFSPSVPSTKWDCKKRRISAMDPKSLKSLSDRLWSSLTLSERYLLQFKGSSNEEIPPDNSKEVVNFIHPQLEQLLSTIIAAQSLTCSLCPVQFQNLPQLQDHYQNVHDLCPPPTTSPCEILFRCHICHRSLSTKQNLRIHVHRHFFGSRSTCPHCKRQFKSRTAKQKHILQCKNINSTESGPPTPLVNHTSFLDQLADNAPDNAVSSDAYVGKSAVHSHVQSDNCASVELEQPIPHEFGDTDCLIGSENDHQAPETIHTMTSQPNIPYVDEQVTPNFESMSLLSTALPKPRPGRKKTSQPKGVSGHSFESINKCHTCDMKFTRATSLRRHELLHTGQAPHVCSVCNRRFVQSYALRRHEMSHLGLKAYKCTHCGGKFSQRYNLKLHIKAFHSEATDA